MPRLIMKDHRRFLACKFNLKCRSLFKLRDTATTSPRMFPSLDTFVTCCALYPIDNRHVARSTTHLFCSKPTLKETGHLIVFRHTRLPMTRGTKFRRFLIDRIGYICMKFGLGTCRRTVHCTIRIKVTYKT